MFILKIEGRLWFRIKKQFLSYNFMATFFTFFFGLYYPFRYILASLYFNENLLRETKKSDGKDYYKVTYPKFKLGEEDCCFTNWW